MTDVETALAAITAQARPTYTGFFTQAEWDAIFKRWMGGISEGVIYDALKAAGRMPYKNERSFYRAFDNQKDKRNGRKWTWDKSTR